MKTTTFRHGEATVVLECHKHDPQEKYGKADVVTMTHSYPLRVLVPEHTGNPLCKWIYPMVYGGGLVGGDQIDINVETRPNTCGLLTSQGSSKVYHCDNGLITQQNMNYIVGDNSLLCVLPDFCVCYKDANFVQTQKVEMSASGSIVLLDWLTCGRMALNEKWLFTSFKNSIEVQVDGEAVYTDNMHLQNTAGQTVKQSMKNYKVLGTCIVLGKHLKEMSNYLYKKYSNTRPDDSVNTGVVCNVSNVHRGGVSGVHIRFMTVDTAKAYTVIKEIIYPLIPLLGDDPFKN